MKILRTNIKENQEEKRRGITFTKNKFGLVPLFNGISTYVGYLVSKPSLLKNSSDSI